MRRSLGPVSLQVLKASAAASTAITASAGVAAGARVATVPSSGLRRSKVAFFSAVTFRPLMSMDRSDISFSFELWITEPFGPSLGVCGMPAEAAVLVSELAAPR